MVKEPFYTRRSLTVTAPTCFQSRDRKGALAAIGLVIS